MLRDFCQSHADACASLYGWYRVANKAQWNNLTEVQATWLTDKRAIKNFEIEATKGIKARKIF